MTAEWMAYLGTISRIAVRWVKSEDYGDRATVKERSGDSNLGYPIHVFPFQNLR